MSRAAGPVVPPRADRDPLPSPCRSRASGRSPWVPPCVCRVADLVCCVYAPSHERGDDRQGSAYTAPDCRGPSWRVGRGCLVLDRDVDGGRLGRSDVRHVAACPRRGTRCRWRSRRTRCRPFRWPDSPTRGWTRHGVRRSTGLGSAVTLDELMLHPEAVEAAITTPPARSGRVPVWTRCSPASPRSWLTTRRCLARRGAGRSPRSPSHGSHPARRGWSRRTTATAPSNCACRNIFLGESELWRRPLEPAV